MDPKKYICALLQSFPYLKYRWLVTPETWNPEALVNEMGVLSSGERYAAAFVLCVWNPYWAESKGIKFDLFDAVACWGDENRKPVLEWLKEPRWP